MTKNEFLNGLKNALANDLDSKKVQSHVSYYSDYIQGEVVNGRTEADVIAELGDPWAIAKTIVLSEETGAGGYEEYSEVSSKKDGYQKNRGPKVHVFGLDSWWKKILLILGLIGVIMIVVAVISGIISLLVPIIVPVIVISFVLKFFNKRK